MKNSLFFVLFAGIALASACKKEVAATAPTDTQNLACATTQPDTITLKIGETACCTDSDWCISVDTIIDGRCPMDVTCVWEGTALVYFSTKKAGATQLDTLSDHENAVAFPDNRATVFGQKIRFIDVSPYPVSSQPVPPSDLTVKIVVEKE